MSEKCFKYLTLSIVLLTLYPIKAHTLEDKYLGESLNSLGVRGKIEIDISNVRGTNGLATLKTEYGGRANLSVYITGINTFKMLGILTYTQNGNTWDAEANCNYLRQSSEPYHTYISCDYTLHPKNLLSNSTITGKTLAFRTRRECRTVFNTIIISPNFGTPMGTVCGYYRY